jgi:uncharacterized peroxidase-related enzyme
MPLSRLPIPAADDAPEASKPILDAINKQLGVVPNMFRLFATSPAALAGLAGLDAANATALDLKTRTGIALAVAQVNRCRYCLSAHTYVGVNLARISPEEAMLNRQGKSGDAKIATAVRFAAKVVERRGQVNESDIAAVRHAGYKDAQVVEIISVIAQNILTNLVNNVVQTDIDFPIVEANELKAA